MDPRSAYDKRDDVQLIDVREPEEWVTGHIEGSLHIPMQTVPHRMDEIARDRPVVAVCRSGRRSGEVARYLGQLGFTAHNLEGGVERWAAEGLPLVRA